MPSEYYWRARNADTNHQNTISGREDRESRTQCHQNTIGGRAMPTPVIRILLAGGRTTNVEHSAIRILLAGGRTTQVEHFCNQNTISGRRDDDSRTQCHQNTISGREDNQRGTHCHQNTFSGRKDRGPPRLGLTKLLTSGRRGFIYAR